MSGVTRKSQDSAGAILIGGSTNVIVNGTGAVRIGDAVKPHALGPHTSAVMVTGSSTVFVNDIPVCKAGDLASCGHKSSGSGNVFAN